jgi:hypothetical protein
MVSVKRGMLVFACAAAFAVSPVVMASPAAAKDCPWGTVPTKFDGVCVQGQAGGFGAPGPVIPPQAGPAGPSISSSPGGIGSVNGIPCTPQHYGTCYGMIQNGGG